MLTYEAPVWEDAIKIKYNLKKLHRIQRLINIKTARTISFEASCIMAGVPHIGLVIQEKVQIYKIRHQ